MTGSHDGGRRSPLGRPVRLVRRVLAPAALELEGELRAFREDVDRLRTENRDLRRRLEESERRLAAVEAQVGSSDGTPSGGLTAAVAQLAEGLKEERRLHLRIAELADVVTELVLPLHDREIDPAALRRLRPDTR